MAEKVDCIIISGAPDNDLAFIESRIKADCFVIAADSGYKKLTDIGLEPDIIIADFDSSDKPNSIKSKVFPVEKDATDTFNALKYAINQGYKSIEILSALGGRFDHTYSNLLCLDYADKHGAYCVISSRNNRLSLINRKAVVRNEYQWFSLFAFLCKCSGVRIKGAHYNESFYNLESLSFDMCDQFGQSNYVEGDFCEITVENGTLLLIESNDIE